MRFVTFLHNRIRKELFFLIESVDFDWFLKLHVRAKGIFFIARKKKRAMN